MELKYTDITVHTKWDEKTFRRFALFDLFVVRKKWVLPAVLALVMIALAAIALPARKGVPAAVLLATGIGLPLAFAGALLLRVNRQIAGAGREPGQPVCTVTMLEEGVRTVNEGQEEAQEADWQSIKRAYRRKGCVYLYVTEQKAFLLPSRQADAPDAEVWDFICEHLGREKCRG